MNLLHQFANSGIPEEDFLVLGVGSSAIDSSWNPWMSPSWWAPVEKMKSRLDGTRSGNPLVLGRRSGGGQVCSPQKGFWTQGE